MERKEVPDIHPTFACIAGTRFKLLDSGVILAVSALCLAFASSPGARPPPAKGKVRSQSTTTPTYSKDIRPILQERCVVCHGAGAVSNPAVSGGLALDSYAAVKQGVAGAKSSFVLVLGKSRSSALYERLVATSPTKLMPKGGPPLPAAQIDLIKRWIDANAPSGVAIKEAGPAGATAIVTPMPPNRPTQDVTIPIKAEFPAGLLEKGESAVALRVGPLPPLTALAYSPDGKRLAIGAFRAVAIWDTVTGQPITNITRLPGTVLALEFKPDGSLLAVGGGVPGASGDVRIFDTKTWTQTGATLAGAVDTIAAVAWSPDGSRIAAGSQDKSARVWDWPSGKELRVFKEHSDGVTRVCFAPDGKSLYTASLDHNARRFDVEKGGLIRLFTGHNEGITAMAVSADGKKLVTSGSEPNLRWWNTETGETTNNVGSHSAPVIDIKFSKDGTIAASASADKTVRIWDGGNTQHKRALAGSTDWVYAAAISPDGRFVAGAGADGMMRLWETATARLRLSVVFWPSVADGAAFDWAVVTPEGYCDGSAGWTGRMTAANPAKGVVPASVRTVLHSFVQPQNVLKAWQNGPLDPIKQPAK